MLKLAALILTILATAQGLEIVGSSETQMVLQGTEAYLYCHSDEPYEVCKWEHLESGRKCRVAADYIGIATTCKEDDKIEWDISETTCGIKILNPARSDAGTYSCILGIIDEQGVSVTEDLQLEVAVVPTVSFVGEIDLTQSYKLDAGKPVEIECQTTGGFPAPLLHVALGQEPYYVDNDFDMFLESVATKEETSDHSDGTVSKKATFLFTPTHDDCGKYIKCFSEQYNPNGDLIKGESSGYASRKLVVEFPPSPPSEDVPKFKLLGDNKDDIVIQLMFSANPAPIDGEVIWHINPSGEDAGVDSIVLAANHNEGHFEAPSLNVSGHHVLATLVIKDPIVEMTNYSYYLEVHTEKGSEQYSFELIHVLPMPEEGFGYDEDEIEEEEGEEIKGMGSGAVAAIIVIVIIICCVIGATLVAKKNHAWCFKYTGVPTNEGPKVVVKKETKPAPSPIIKNGATGKIGHEKHEKAETTTVESVDETDRNNESKDGSAV